MSVSRKIPDDEFEEFWKKFIKTASATKVSRDSEDSEWFLTLKGGGYTVSMQFRFFTRDETEHFYMSGTVKGGFIPQDLDWKFSSSDEELCRPVKEKMLRAYHGVSFSDQIGAFCEAAPVSSVLSRVKKKIFGR